MHYVIVALLVCSILYIGWITSVLHNMIQGLYRVIHNLEDKVDYLNDSLDDDI